MDLAQKFAILNSFCKQITKSQEIITQSVREQLHMFIAQYSQLHCYVSSHIYFGAFHSK